jgi:hypothetical protein
MIPVAPETLMRLLDDVGRTRALLDDETDLVELIVTRGHRGQGVKLKWTADIERELRRVSARPSGVRSFAARYGITEQAAYDKLSRLRGRKANLRGNGQEG